MRTAAKTDTLGDTRSPASFFTSLKGWLSDRVWHARPNAPQQWWQALALVVVCLSVYLPGLFTIPPIDRDESRFAQASRQMYESVALPEAERAATPLDLYSGGLVAPYVIDKPRLNKPPLVYWLQAGSAAIFSLGEPLNDAIWMYRVPSVLSAIAAVLITWRIGLLMFDARAAWLGAALLAICPVVVVDAHQARADQLLLACTTGAMWALTGIVKEDRRASWDVPPRSRRISQELRLASGLATAIALGVLAKGPITPMIVALSAVTYAVLTRRWRILIKAHPWLSVLAVAATIGPWVYLVAEHFGFAEYKALILDETVGRSTSAKEGHAGPPGYHALLLPVLFFPGSLGLALANIHLWKRSAIRGWKWGGSWQLALIVAWLVPSWVVFEFVSTKLPHYTMPLYPAGALLCARALVAETPRRILASSGPLKALAVLWCAIPTIFGLALIGFGIAYATCPDSYEAIRIIEPSPRDNTLIALGCIASGLILLTAFYWPRGTPTLRTTLTNAIVAWSLAFMLVATLATPKLQDLSPRVAQELHQTNPRAPAILADYQEDSLVFLLRGNAIRAGSEARTIAEHNHGAPLVLRSEAATPDDLERGILITGNSVSLGLNEAVIIRPPSP